MGATVVEKMARSHQEEGPDRGLRPGDMVMLRPRHLLTHDNTAAVMAKYRAIGATTIHDRRQPVIALDHEIQNDSPANSEKYDHIRAFAARHGIDFHPAGTGIGHQIMIERGYALPGSLVVASDSHANMYGAVGALGTPVVRTDAASIWATGRFWWQIPRTVQVVLEGRLRPGVSGKDVILTLCAVYNRGEVLNAAVEFAGPGVAALDMSARMSIANMTTEWGALTGWFPVDAVALAYLRERCAAGGGPESAGARIDRAQLHAWSVVPPAPDVDAAYAARITLDLSRVVPFLAGPDDVQTGVPVMAVADDGIGIDRAYLLSCVNGRIEDLEAAAMVLRGRRVAAGVSLYVAAASLEVQHAAEASGAWATLLAAGATPLPPGCGPCIGLGAGLLEDGEVGISATNRNFRGRMGARSARVYLASPRVVAESALAGRITGGPGGVGQAATVAERRYELLALPAPPPETVQTLPGFPPRLRGRLLFVPRENLNTDGIYGKDHTYRELSAAEMAAAVMQNYDPDFAELVRPGDILIGTRNFGTGSSREQAATALQAAGIALVVAETFSQTYLRNAFNNGFICLECAPFVHAVERQLGRDVANDDTTIVPGDDVTVDFVHGTIAWRDELHRFPPLGAVPQALVVAGGVEPQIRHRLGLIEQYA